MLTRHWVAIVQAQKPYWVPLKWRVKCQIGAHTTGIPGSFFVLT